MHRQHLKRLLYFFPAAYANCQSKPLCNRRFTFFTVPGNCMDKNALYILGMHYAKKQRSGEIWFFLTLGCLQKGDFHTIDNYNRMEVPLC